MNWSIAENQLIDFEIYFASALKYLEEINMKK